MFWGDFVFVLCGFFVCFCCCCFLSVFVWCFFVFVFVILMNFSCFVCLDFFFKGTIALLRIILYYWVTVRSLDDQWSCIHYLLFSYFSVIPDRG